MSQSSRWIQLYSRSQIQETWKGQLSMIDCNQNEHSHMLYKQLSINGNIDRNAKSMSTEMRRNEMQSV